jgi:hypothetical protein
MYSSRLSDSVAICGVDILYDLKTECVRHDSVARLEGDLSPEEGNSDMLLCRPSLSDERD